MAAVRPRFDVHNLPFTPQCTLSLLACLPLSLASMLVGNVSAGRVCIPSLCLKYLVICIANALLATGWLLISVLSIFATLLPTVLNVPPTLPKMSPREASPRARDKERVARTSISMTTGVEVSYERAAGGQIITSHAVLESTQTVRHNGMRSQRVRFAGSEESGPVASTSRAGTPPQTPERRTTTLTVESFVNSPESYPDSLPSPPLPSGSGAVDPGVVRGRKHGFLRRQLSEKQSRSAATPGSFLPTPPHSAATSPARSPERRDSTGLQRSFTAPLSMKPCRRRSGDSGPSKGPVLRTDPYQAPYFFPTPMSPDAIDYVDKVRSERVLGFSPESRPKPSPPASRSTRSPSPHTRQMQQVQPPLLPTPAASPQRTAHLDLAPESPRSTAAEIPTSSNSSGSRPGSLKRRSWHISLHSHHQRDNGAPRAPLERPTSWTSEAATSSSGESYNQAASRPRLSGFWRRGSAHQLAPLSPLESTVGIDDVHNLKHKRSWHIFHHHSASESHATPATDSELNRPRLSRI